MTEPLKTSMLGILSWMKERQSGAFTSLDELTAQFDVTRDHMKSLLQSLQRNECVKRGGSENAEWSITEHGLMRLEVGGFSPSGAFLTTFEPTDRSSEKPREQDRPVTLISVPLASESETPDTPTSGNSLGPASWAPPRGVFYPGSTKR